MAHSVGKSVAKPETTLEAERLSAASKVAIDLANYVFIEQMRVAHWQEVKLNESVKSLVEAHFIVGIFDSATTDWVVPTPSPDRASSRRGAASWRCAEN